MLSADDVVHLVALETVDAVGGEVDREFHHREREQRRRWTSPPTPHPSNRHPRGLECIAFSWRSRGAGVCTRTMWRLRRTHGHFRQLRQCGVQTFLWELHVLERPG